MDNHLKLHVKSSGYYPNGSKELPVEFLLRNFSVKIPVEEFLSEEY